MLLIEFAIRLVNLVVTLLEMLWGFIRFLFGRTPTLRPPKSN